MNEIDFPVLYRTADAASGEAQKDLLIYYRLNNLLLILAAIIASWEPVTVWKATVSAGLFIGSLFLYLYGKYHNLQAKWYKARALAESIKTATWKFMMNADPFHTSDQASLEQFQRILIQLLKANAGIGSYLASANTEGSQITQSAYSLTSQEIGVVKSYFDEISDSTELSQFVSDAENAFSREHTQWAARRDHAI